MSKIIKLEELRFGNYFLHNSKIAQFDEEIMHDVVYGVLEGDERIPLTEEWLLKFGFVIGEYYKNYKIQTGFGWHSIKKFEDHWIYSIDESDAGCYTVALLTDVHELQNIHFVLSGFELKIN